jgi:hypothetical protein
MLTEFYVFDFLIHIFIFIKWMFTSRDRAVSYIVGYELDGEGPVPGRMLIFIT